MTNLQLQEGWGLCSSLRCRTKECGKLIRYWMAFLSFLGGGGSFQPVYRGDNGRLSSNGLDTYIAIKTAKPESLCFNLSSNEATLILKTKEKKPRKREKRISEERVLKSICSTLGTFLSFVRSSFRAKWAVQLYHVSSWNLGPSEDLCYIAFLKGSNKNTNNKSDKNYTASLG